MRSSYQKNNYGEIFRAMVDAYKPINVVELGVLEGYSTVAIAEGLERNGRGMLKAYDLFEDYPYRHAKHEDVKAALARFPLIVEVIKMDAFEVYHSYSASTVDFLHVDLSNTGETVQRIMDQWDSKIVQGGVILFEGGTEERDREDWMIKYDRPSIKREIETNEIIQRRYIYGTYLKWPGLTMLLKKR